MLMWEPDVPRHFLTLILISILADASLSGSAMATGGWKDQDHRINRLRARVDLYYRDTGEFPVTDSESSWFEKLIVSEHADQSVFQSFLGSYGIDPVRNIPLDFYGSPMICELVVSPAGEEEVVVRCTGPNGIDDGGALDDWDSRWGANPGYWYRSHWPALYRSALVWGLICAFVTIALIFLLFRYIRHRAVAMGLVLVITGFIWHFFWPEGRFSNPFIVSTADHPDKDPWWLNSVHSIAFLSLLFGLICLVYLGFREFNYMLLRRREVDTSLCAKCRYDLRGSPGNICPECGTSRPNTGGDTGHE